MRVESLCRYPVKSMLGETVDSLCVDARGAERDRRLALLDETTGHVASAKQARLWRGLLQCTARTEAGAVRIALREPRTVSGQAVPTLRGLARGHTWRSWSLASSPSATR